MLGHLSRGCLLAATVAFLAGAQTRESPFEIPSAPAPQGTVDELVFGRLKRLGIPPSKLCSDAVFLRRTYLDVIGTLPTAREASEFIQNSDHGKRGALIDRLLEREEFADYWAMKWCDLLRVKSEFPVNLWPNAVQAYHRWIRSSIRKNVPYDQFVRALLTSSGSNFRVPEVNFYRAVQGREPQTLARAVALTFMGARAENWPRQRLEGMAAFFSRIGYKPTGEWKEEIVFFDPGWGKPGAADSPAAGVFPDGATVRLSPDRDPREAFAAWLVAPGNPWFARNIVNRVWYWLLGRGIIHEPDDVRPDNPAANPELLAYLEKELVSSHYDLKHIYRLILNSAVYQLASVPAAGGAEAVANFASYPMRRLDAEVLIDAICQITGMPEQYSSPIPEPFTFLPENQRAVALADGSVTSAFLEMFGRPARDTGLESERNNRITAEQRLHLLNSSHIQLKIQQSEKLRSLLQPTGRPRDAVDRIYLTILARYPTDEELGAVTAYFQLVKGNRWPAVVDLAWSLINSGEFLHRH